jgi:hypothetical protein
LATAAGDSRIAPGACRSGGHPGEATEGELLPLGDANVVRGARRDATLKADVEDRLDALGWRAGPLAEDDGPRPGGLDDPRLGDGGEDVGRPTEDMWPADRGGDLLLVVDAVLERDDGRARVEQRPETSRRRLGVVRLDAERTTSTVPIVAGLSVATSWWRVVPSGVTIVRPRSRRAASLAPRAMRLTWAPPSDIRAP